MAVIGCGDPMLWHCHRIARHLTHLEALFYDTELIAIGGSEMEIRFRQDARAIIILGRKVLTCRLVGRHSFYPGGGVDLGERATDALLRELREELGITARVKGFLGAYEWLWNEENGQPHHNISHFFEVESDDLIPGEDPVSREPHLEFRWATVDEIAGWPVFPEAVHLLVQAVMNGERRPWWCSEVRNVELL